MNVFIGYLTHTIEPHNKHYLNRLVKIISHYKSIESSTKIVGHEDHHIVPYSWLKGMGFGKNESKRLTSINPENFVYLPAKAHYVLHHLYWKAFPKDPGLAYAFYCMKNVKKNIISAKTFDSLRRASHEFLSEVNKGRTQTPEHRRNNANARVGKPAVNKGIPRTDEVKQKISATLTGKIVSVETREKMKLTSVCRICDRREMRIANYMNWAKKFHDFTIPYGTITGRHGETQGA